MKRSAVANIEHADAFEPGGEATFKPIANETVSGNRRMSPRYAVELEVTLASEHNFYAGFAENLSDGGIFIATHVKKAVGERLELTIVLEGTEEPIRGVGEVRWVRQYSETSNVPPGLGLRFVELSPESQQAIEAFLESREPLFHDE